LGLLLEWLPLRRCGMLNKNNRFMFAVIYMIIVLCTNYFYDLSSTTLTILLAIYLGLQLIYDVAKLNSEEKKKEK
jgi:electron transfer flavoprotein alpha/beta subunit